MRFHLRLRLLNYYLLRRTANIAVVKYCSLRPLKVRFNQTIDDVQDTHSLQVMTSGLSLKTLPSGEMGMVRIPHNTVLPKCFFICSPECVWVKNR